MTLIRENLDLIADYIVANRDRIATNVKLSDVLEDDIIGHVDLALKTELSQQPYQQARPRLAPVNVGRKIIRKLSSLYSEKANRDLSDPTDDKLWKFYTEEMSLDTAMSDANHFFNTHKYTALEPYVTEEREPRLRVLPADRFLVWSDGSSDDPSIPQVFIKFMGVPEAGLSRFELWSDEEVITVDMGGKILGSNDRNFKVVSGDQNPYGKLPFIYITRSKYRIMPSPDEALFSMTVLVPLLLTDLNMISKFQSYSMMYTIDVDVNNLQYGPSNVFSFKSDQKAGTKPQVGVLSPNADIEALNQSILNQLSMFLETRNLKASSAGKATGDTAASGISLMIRNIDTTEDRKAQAVMFERAEKQLLDLVANYMHPVWTSRGEISDLRSFSSNPSLMVKFADPAPLVTEEERIDNALKKRDNALTTQRLALAEVHPEMTQEDLDRLAEEIKDEQSTILEVRSVPGDSDTSSLEPEESEEDR